MNTPPTSKIPDRVDPETTSPKTPRQSLLVDLGPLLVFVVAYNLANRTAKDNAIFLATAAFMTATALAIGWAWFRQNRLPPMLIVTGVLVGVFGSLTLLFQDSIFIKIKPTIINILYAGILLGGLLVRCNVWKILLSGSLTLPDRIWNILAFRWGLWFLVLAVINEIVWRNFSEQFWANFKLLGLMPLTLLFALANMPITIKHIGKTD